MKQFKNLFSFIGHLLLWPIGMLLEGYHDSNEGSWFVSSFLSAGIVVPICVFILVKNISAHYQVLVNFTGVLALYIFIGFLANLFARDFWGEGFL